MYRFFRRILDHFTQKLLEWHCLNKLARFIAYQLKRATRRNVEARLCVRGLYGNEVISGPFQGMLYPEAQRWASHRFEKIIGAYEHELHNLLFRLASSKNYDVIVNVGAAEGFYACGLARLFPSARIVSYESDKECMRFCHELCCLNHVIERVDIHGSATLQNLAQVTSSESVLVWMDVEGKEQVLLDPAKILWLQRADIVVELHDCFDPGLGDLIRDRFEVTHNIERFASTGLNYSNYPLLRGLLFSEIDALVGEERRSLQDWFFMEPRQLCP